VSAITIGGIVFAVVFGSALLGMRIRTIVPEDHLSHESRDVIKLGMGLIGTMAALVLSLLISSAKTSFDTRAAEVTQVTANVILLVLWLAVILMSFVLFVRRTPTATVVPYACALASSSAIFLVLELDQPFEGVIRISSTPMRQIIVHLGR